MRAGSQVTTRTGGLSCARKTESSAGDARALGVRGSKLRWQGLGLRARSRLGSGLSADGWPARFGPRSPGLSAWRATHASSGATIRARRTKQKALRAELEALRAGPGALLARFQALDAASRWAALRREKRADISWRSCSRPEPAPTTRSSA